MKRHGNLWESMISFESLLEAADKGPRGKRFRPAVARFHFDQERELLEAPRRTGHQDLSTGAYRSFFIYEPKKRQISAAPYRDRVVHHALTAVLEPIFERSFIADSYACRKGKGTHAAVDRCQQFARRFRYVLKADIQKFFPSVDHEHPQGPDRPQDQRPGRAVAGRPDHRPQQSPGVGAAMVPRRRLVHARRTPPWHSHRQPDQPVLRQRLPRPARPLRQGPVWGSRAMFATSMTFWCSPTTRGTWLRSRAELTGLLSGLRLRLHPTKNVIFPGQGGHPVPRLPSVPNASPVAKGQCAAISTPGRGRCSGIMPRAACRLREIRQRIMSWSGHARQANTYRLRCTSVSIQSVFQRATTE